MKAMKRLLLCLLVLCLSTASFSSCMLVAHLITRQQVTTEEVAQLPTATDPSGRPEAPSLGDDLTYRLTQADVDLFYERLEALEVAVLDAARSESEIQTLLEELAEQYYDIATQETLAMLQYYLDMSNESASEAYTFASESSTQAYDRYNEMCKRLDASDAPHKATFFADWTEEELADMRSYSEAHSALKLENEALVMEYQALSEGVFTDGAAAIYAEILQNNDEIAGLYGYESYREYAFEEIYERDLTAADIRTVRTYVKRYVLPLIQTLIESFQISYQSLSTNEKRAVQAYFELDYATAENTMNAYFATFPEKVRERMVHMLDEKNSVFAESENAYDGAFTTYLFSGKRPICYFGPSYGDPLTIIHEMGHYLAYADNGRMTEASLDLAEVQSTGNEWLFLSYFLDTLAPDVAKTISFYELYRRLASNVIVPLIVDEFEERCYRELPTDPNRLDAIMTELLGEWGGGAWLATYVGDLQSYWRYVVIENPIYYVSYAISMLTVIGIYTEAEENSYGAAQELYLGLVLDVPCEQGFLGVIEAAGLLLPTDETLYTDLCRLVA